MAPARPEASMSAAPEVEHSDWAIGFGRYGGEFSHCCGAWICVPCFYGQISERFDAYPRNITTNMDMCSSTCALFALSSICCFIPAMLKRHEMREKWVIPGNMTEDCFVSACCMPCSLAQMMSEVKDRAKKAEAERQQQYQSQQQGMAYQRREGPQQPDQPLRPVGYVRASKLKPKMPSVRERSLEIPQAQQADAQQANTQQPEMQQVADRSRALSASDVSSATAIPAAAFM